jgi:hypothetical protein
MRWLAVVAIVSACKFVPPSGGIDGTADDDAPGDDAKLPDAFVLGDWGTPVPVVELNSMENDDDPTLPADMLEIYFASTRLPQSPDEDIYFATRATVNERFGAPQLSNELSSNGFDSNVDISADGLTIVFSSNRNGGADLYFSTRTARDAAWSVPAIVGGANSVGGEWGGVLSADMLSIVLCSDRGGDEAIYVAKRLTTTDPFSTPVKLDGIDTAANECDAMMPTPDTIYFTRGTVATDLELYVAQRGATGFEGVTAITSLDTTSRDGDPWVSADQRTMYFASNRPGIGPDDIYMSTR